MIRKGLRYISYITTVIIAAVFLLASFATEIPPYRMMLPSLLGLAYPLVLVVWIVCALYWVIRMRWKALIFIALISAISWRSISAYFPIHREANKERLAEIESQGKRPLKILSYNVCAFGFLEHKASRPNPTLLYIKSSNADIVCLQEAWTLAISLDQIKAYFKKEYPHISVIRSQANGSMLMLLSRYPIKSAKRLEIRSHANGAAAFVVDINGAETHIVNLHFESFRLNKSIGKEYMELVARGDAWALEEAFKAKFAPIFRMHNEQANVVHEYIKAHDDKRTIVCGDFNDTPVSYTLGKVGEGLQDCFVESGNGLGFSFRSKLFRVRIDHILVGKAFRPIYTEVDRSAHGSDHYPIYSYVLDETSHE